MNFQFVQLIAVYQKDATAQLRKMYINTHISIVH